MFARFKENSYRKLVRMNLARLLGEVNLRDWEYNLPQSSVDNAYRTAWVMFGKEGIQQHPSLYRIAVAEGVVLVGDMLTATSVALGMVLPEDVNAEV